VRHVVTDMFFVFPAIPSDISHIITRVALIKKKIGMYYVHIVAWGTSWNNITYRKTIIIVKLYSRFELFTTNLYIYNEL